MKIDRFLRRRLVYLFVVGAVEWSISSSSVLWRSPTEMMFGDDLDSPLIHILIGEMKEEKNSQLLGAFTNTTLQSVKLVDAVDEGGKEPTHIEIEVEKYAAESGVEGDYDAQFKNLGNLVTNLQDQILYKLDEGLKHVASTSQSR
uniref:PI31 proteasome regulator N-terminal domain-containing protein n=1 Tax=Brassica oleracea TaxID=3712 RepID=A0A3P6EFP4_BRAOL|nr:unnamed protein product [Brassica oleracea]